MNIYRNRNIQIDPIVAKLFRIKMSTAASAAAAAAAAAATAAAAMVVQH